MVPTYIYNIIILLCTILYIGGGTNGTDLYL